MTKTKKAGPGPVTRALARVSRQLSRMPAPGEGLMPGRTEVIDAVVLRDEVNISTVGLTEVALTEQENAVLNEAAKLEDIRVKPSGQAYLSHPTYTKWFNRAFGRLGWMIVPSAKPTRTDKGVAQAFLFYIHGKPAVIVTGEQDYHENNREQSYADALEGCVGSALRRTAKRLGVGLELWDRPFLDAYMHEHCVMVRVPKRVRDHGTGKWSTKVVNQWRRRVDAPFPDELKPGDKASEARVDEEEGVEPAQRRQSAPPSERPAGYNAKAGEPISDAQLRRFHTIVTNSGRQPEVVKRWLLDVWKYDTSKDISRGNYDAICKAVEGDGKLQ